MKSQKTFYTSSPIETEQVGEQIGGLLKKGDVVFLFGDLGAGKTTLIKGLVRALTGTPSQEVTSPTFTYLHTYSGPIDVYHFDLYRLSKEEEFLSAGFDEFLEGQGIACIEWPDRLPKKFNLSPIHIHIQYKNFLERTISVQGFS